MYLYKKSPYITKRFTNLILPFSLQSRRRKYNVNKTIAVFGNQYNVFSLLFIWGRNMSLKTCGS